MSAAVEPEDWEKRVTQVLGSVGSARLHTTTRACWLALLDEAAFNGDRPRTAVTVAGSELRTALLSFAGTYSAGSVSSRAERARVRMALMTSLFAWA